MKKLPLLLLFLTLTLSAQQVKFTGTAEPILKELLKDFHQSARYAKVGNIKQLDSVRTYLFVKADLNMLGEISPDGKTIYLNEELREFEHLTRIILFRQIGKIYGLKDSKRSQEIMGTNWQINVKNEWHAENLATREWFDRHFFEALQKRAPLEKRL